MIKITIRIEKDKIEYSYSTEKESIGEISLAISHLEYIKRLLLDQLEDILGEIEEKHEEPIHPANQTHN